MGITPFAPLAPLRTEPTPSGPCLSGTATSTVTLTNSAPPDAVVAELLDVVEERLRLEDLLDDSAVAALGEDGYVIFDDAVDPAVCLAARMGAEILWQHQVLTPAVVSREGVAVAGVRSDHTCFLEESALPEAFVGVVTRLGRLQEELRTKAWLALPRREFQLACYPPQSQGYARHRDSFAHPVTSTAGTAPGLMPQRRITAVLYLNPDWQDDDGGALRIWPDAPAPAFDVLPRLGRLVLFQSDRIDHAVLPCRRDRFALTLWLSAL